MELAKSIPRLKPYGIRLGLTEPLVVVPVACGVEDQPVLGMVDVVGGVSVVAGAD